MAVPKLRFKEFNNNWDEESFNEIFDFLSNNSLSRSDLNYEIGDMYNLHYGDILIKIENILNCEKYILPYINKNKQTERLNVSFLKENDIIFADTAEDYTAGKCCEIININEKKIASGLHTIPCRPKRSFALGYLGYYLNSNYYHKQLLPLITGTKVYGISKRSIIDTYIRFPSLEEQEKISNLLNKLDQKIELQKKKIEALKLYKKGLMQRLLNCSNNIDCKVADFGNVITGTTPSKNNKDFWNNGDIVWITPSDINDNKIIYESQDKLTNLGLKAGRFVPCGSLLVTCIASIGKNAILKIDGSCNQQINAIIPNDKFNVDYLYYLIEHNKKYLQSLAGTSATSIINKSSFEEISFKVPDLKSQIKISTFLNYIDSKVDFEKDKFDCLIKVKKHLLQEMFI